MVTSDESFIYPPLCTWEKDPMWKHPEWYKIKARSSVDMVGIFEQGLGLYNCRSFICPFTSSEIGLSLFYILLYMLGNFLSFWMQFSLTISFYMDLILILPSLLIIF